VVTPDRDVRAFQSVLIDLGARLKLPGFVTETGAPAVSQRLIRTTSSTTSERPASARSPDFAAPTGRLRPRRAQSQAA